ncbi:MAG TPA: TRAP transporter substrate-binding protein [Mesorhizobium sp.]|jgi:TRAP-type C4-dicarboxylate transport system substrate-binding protein|nr:TRAP transporter substrate-binding protein [Mesorhizobium sp.]
MAAVKAWRGCIPAGMCELPRKALGAAAALGLAWSAATGVAVAEEPIRLKVVGGLGMASQYARFEEPFWTKRIGELSDGRIEATIHPYDKSGLRAQDLMQLMRLGVVPWGNLPLSVAAHDEPELNAVDLPGLNPDIRALRRTITAYRPYLEQVLAERHGIVLLGVHAYPAQVIFCREAFARLDDLAGRRVRTSAVAQSEFVEGLRGIPVITPFGEIAAALKDGVVDCAITGTLGGNEIGLHEITSHVHGMAVSWGVTLFGANAAAWGALPPDLQAVIRKGMGDLEATVLLSAEFDTARGIACNTGAPGCGDGRLGGMTLVPPTIEDEARRRSLLVSTVLPRWIGRCGDACVRSWNDRLAPMVGLSLAH